MVMHSPDPKTENETRPSPDTVQTGRGRYSAVPSLAADPLVTFNTS